MNVKKHNNMLFLFKRDYAKFANNKVLFFTTIGILFGSMFPLSAIFFEMWHEGLPISHQSVLQVHKLNHLLYMIDTAPFFLGLFSFFIGVGQAKLHKQLYYDNITGLLNRYSLQGKCNDFKQMTETNGKNIAIVIINMSNYTRISHMGNEFVNNTLIIVANMFKNICKEGETLFRLSNGEFLIIKIGGNLHELGNRINQLFEEPIQIMGYKHKISINIGIAVCDDRGLDYQVYLDRAYIAMEKHRRNKRVGYVQFEKEMYTQLDELKMETELYSAITNGELFLVYQPIVQTNTKLMKGAEALLRWNSPKFGFVSPADFIYVLEHSGLIVPVGLWVAKEAFRQAKAIHEMGHEDFYISVNLSIIQLLDTDFVKKLNDIVAEVGIDKKSIKLEITESVTSKSRDFVRDILLDLHHHGFYLSIDDFGTGYSSLSELELMPLDNLKIDKSFIDRYNATNKNNSTIEAIVTMAMGLGLNVIVEGVETKEQYEYLAKLQCDFIQGYYFSKPLSSEAIIQLFDKEL